jgi:hypothetical protein
VPAVTVRLPRLLEPAVGPVRTIHLEAAGLAESIDQLLDRHPSLRVHLFDEAGELRPHVLCFVDGAATRLEDRDQQFTQPVEITFLQAVSGGTGHI